MTTIKVWDHYQKVLGYLWTEDGKVKADAGTKFLLESPYYPLLQPGPGGKVLTVDDGDDFLRVLPIYYSGSNVRAGFVADTARGVPEAA
jgi:hypothetical protein